MEKTGRNKVGFSKSALNTLYCTTWQNKVFIDSTFINVPDSHPNILPWLWGDGGCGHPCVMCPNSWCGWDQGENLCRYGRKYLDYLSRKSKVGMGMHIAYNILGFIIHSNSILIWRVRWIDENKSAHLWDGFRPELQNRAGVEAAGVWSWFGELSPVWLLVDQVTFRHTLDIILDYSFHCVIEDTALGFKKNRLDVLKKYVIRTLCPKN